MTELLYTTAELSDIMHVGKSTIKRWTEEGKLRCLRTPGGHRKFRSSDIQQFLSKYHYEISLPEQNGKVKDKILLVQRGETTLTDLISDSCQKVVKNDHRFIEQQLVGMYAAGNTVAEIFDTYLTPLLKVIADFHANKKITTVEFQIAKNTLIHSLIFFADTLPKGAAKSIEMYCLTANERLNEVELKAIEVLLEHIGISVFNLGTVLTKYDAGDLVKQCKPDDVFVVVSIDHSPFEIGQQFHDLVRGVNDYGGTVYTSNITGGDRNIEDPVGLICQQIVSFSDLVEHFSTIENAH